MEAPNNQELTQTEREELDFYREIVDAANKAPKEPDGPTTAQKINSFLASFITLLILVVIFWHSWNVGFNSVWPNVFPKIDFIQTSGMLFVIVFLNKCFKLK